MMGSLLRFVCWGGPCVLHGSAHPCVCVGGCDTQHTCVGACLCPKSLLCACVWEDDGGDDDSPLSPPSVGGGPDQERLLRPGRDHLERQGRAHGAPILRLTWRYAMPVPSPLCIGQDPSPDARNRMWRYNHTPSPTTLPEKTHTHHPTPTPPITHTNSFEAPPGRRRTPACPHTYTRTTPARPHTTVRLCHGSPRRAARPPDGGDGRLPPRAPHDGQGPVGGGGAWPCEV